VRSTRRQNSGRYWLISGIIHGLILIAILLSPAGQVIWEKEVTLQEEIIMDEEEVADLTEEVRNMTVEKLKYQVDLLSEGRDRMATNFEIMNKHYQPFVSDQISTARDRIVQEIRKLRELQEQILAAAERAVAEGEGGSDPMWRTYDRTRAGIVAGQEEIRRAVMLTASDNDDLVAMQIQAEDDQMSAFEALQDSVSAQNHLWGEKKNVDRYEGRIKSYSENVALYRGRINEGHNKKREYEQGVVDAKKNLEKQKKEFETAKAEFEKAKGSDDEKKAKSRMARAEKDFKRAERGVQKAESRVAKNESSIKTNTKRLADVEQRLENTSKEYEKYQAGLPTALTKRDQGAADVVRLQKQAIEGQQKVYDVLLALLEKKAEEAAEQDASESDTATQPVEVGES